MSVSGRYLLDTNIIIGLLNGEKGIADALGESSEVFVPVVAIGELYFGAAKSGRPEANRILIEKFIEGRVVLPCDLAVARQYGRVKNELRSRGAPLPENDIWIGAIALHHALTLVSRDHHFREVEGLAVESW
jgi:tRNA(fMet)-specific endonuclease VapC